MDSPTNPLQNQPSQPVTGFSFPVTSVVSSQDTASSSVASSPTVAPADSIPTVGGVTVSSPANTDTIINNPAPQAGGITLVEQKSSRSKTKDIFLVGLLLILLAGAIFGFTKVRSLLSSAAEDGCVPTEVVEQDLTANSIVINFKTAEACKMQVAYGVDEVLGLQMSEQIMATDHRIKLSPLMPSTPYKYQIRHDETKYEPTRGFLSLQAAAAASTNRPTVVVPTRNLTPVVQPSGRPTGGVTLAPVVTSTASGTVTPVYKYTIDDFQLHFGSVDPRFDTDKNGVVNIRDWQLYNK